MRVLVIGASGYLGSHLVRRFVAAGMKVTGLSRSPAGDASIIADGAEPVHGDLANLAPVLTLARDFNVVLYAAQLPLRAEFEAVDGLLRALEGSGVTFVFTSGTGVLAQRTDGDWSEDSFAETDFFTPSKYVGFRTVTESRVTAAGVLGGLRAIVVRPPLIWGDGGCAHIARFQRDVVEYGDVAYLGPGLNLYSNVHVDDLADLYARVVDRGVGGALYHAVAGEVDNRRIAEAVGMLAGVSVKSVDFSEGVRRWGKFYTLMGMSVCSRSRSPRSRRELEWRPRHLDLLTDVAHPAYRRASDRPAV